MMVSTTKGFARLAISFAIAGIALGVLGCRNGETGLHTGDKEPAGTVKPPPTEGNDEKSAETALPPTTEKDAVYHLKRLTDAGWKPGPAKSVVDLNEEWFAIQAEENPGGLAIQLKLLSDLGKHRDLQGFIAQHPETAGLLASVKNPQLIVDSLRRAEADGQYDRVAGLYMQHAAPQDAEEIARALERNYDLICMLHLRGLLGCEAMFVFKRGDTPSEEYETWLREVLSSMSTASDDERAATVNMIMQHGPLIRKRMQADAKFGKRFRTDLWPRLNRVVSSQQGAFEHYLDEQHLWDLLALDNGEALLLGCGRLAIDLLYGDPELDHSPYPEELHEKIIQVLLRREELAIHSLFKFRDEPQFRRLLQRDLSPDTRSAALAQLIKAGVNYPEKLALFERIKSDSALAEEVGPPPAGFITWVPLYYTLYEVPKKRLQGREPTNVELFSAAADPVFLAIDIATFGQSAAGRTVLVKGGTTAAKQGTKAVAEKGAKNLLVTTLRNTGLKRATKRAGKKVAEKMGERELVKWSITGTLSKMQNAVRLTAGKATTFEITKPVQFMFRHSGVGRGPIKRWAGMEARLFMRGDAKVFVRLGNAPAAIAGGRGAAFLNYTAGEIAMNAAAESEPAQQAVRTGVKQAISAKAQLDAWKQNASAWWLLNASTIN